MLHAPSSPQSRQRGTGLTSLDGVVESRRPEYVPGLEGCGANILEDALNTWPPVRAQVTQPVSTKHRN